MALSFEDISERKQAEEIRARLAAIVQSSDDAIVSKDVNGIITSWNAGAERLFGYTSQETVGQSITMLIPHNRLDEESDILERLRRGERLEHFETVRRRKNGSLVYVSLTVSPIKDSGGVVIGASKIARDITDRRRAQAALLIKERQLQHIADNTAVLIAQCTRDLRYAFVNRACADFLGRSTDEIVGCRIPEIIGDSAFESIRPHIDRVLRGERVEFETEIEYATIGRRCMRVVYVPDTGPDGGVCGWIAAVSDLTDRRKAERDLEASEQRYRSLVSVITDVPWAADAGGAFTSTQPHWAEYTGQTWEQMKGFGWTEALHPDDRETVHATWEDAKRDGAMYESGARLWHAATRRYRHVVVRATPIRDDRGAIQEWVGACTDVDDQVRARERLEAIVAERTAELKASMMQLQAAGRLAALGNMAAGLGHDIANMVLPIRSRLELLQPMCHTEEARADLEAIDKSLTHLTNLSAGLRLMALDPARGGASSPVTDLAEWWYETQGVLRGMLPRSVRLAIDIDPSAAGTGVAMPRHQLTQAVFNLVQNAGEALSGRGKRGRDRLAPARPSKDKPRHDPDHGRRQRTRNRPGESRALFRTYFSTKGRAIATGMGLGMVRGHDRIGRGLGRCAIRAGRGSRVFAHGSCASPNACAGARRRQAAPHRRHHAD
jgi:PAS domain S-box-containing protein